MCKRMKLFKRLAAIGLCLLFMAPQTVTAWAQEQQEETTAVETMAETTAAEVTAVTSQESTSAVEEMTAGESTSAAQQEGVQTGEDVVINNDETGIPDVNFYNALLEQYDENHDGKLTTLEAEKIVSLAVVYEEIKSIQGVQNFKNIVSLDVSWNDITDISCLQNMKLTSLHLSGNKVNDISALEGMPLNFLQLRNCGISDISPLSGMPLSNLDLGGNNISDISPLSGMSFYGLDLDGNNISDISDLKETTFEILWLYGNYNLTDISALEGKKIKVLNLSNTKIGDISVLKGMPLEGLDIMNCGVSDISPLEGMPLKTLDISYNNISDISVLADMELTSLKMSYNNITSIASIKDSKLVESLGNFASTDIAHNVAYFSDDSLSNVIKDIELAAGNKITLNEAMEILPESLLNYKVDKWNRETGEYEKTDFTWLDTEKFIKGNIVKNDETGIPDVNFYNALLNAGDSDHNGVLTEQELAAITKLDASRKSITDITGLEYCTSLLSLNLSNNQITDVTPLRNLDKIKELDITYNNISDLSPLKDSPLTERLRQYAIETQDTYELANFSGGGQNFYSPIKLARGNSYTTTHAKNVLPEELINYHYGHLTGDDGEYKELLGQTWILYDYSDDEEIKNDETGIPDANLYKILLETGDANNDGVLTRYEANRITKVNASGLGITSIEGIQYLNGICEKLDLSNNNISDISPLAAGPMYLDELRLNNNYIEDITPLSLRRFDSYYLNLSYNSISDISCLKEVYLDRLYLDYNKISDLSGLVPDYSKGEYEYNHGYGLRENFTTLSCANNEITDITPLSWFPEECTPEYITLNNNKITDISPLAEYISLSSLSIMNNKITDISCLEKCEKLSTLNLCGNQISDISVVNNMSLSRFSIESDNELKDLSKDTLAGLNERCMLVVCRYLDDENRSISPSQYYFLRKESNSTYQSRNYEQKAVEGYEPADGEYCTVEYTIPRDSSEPHYIDFYYTKASEPETDTGEYVVDIDTSNTDISRDDFNKILGENIKKDVIFKSNLEITIKFAKGTMKEVSGKISYDMGSEMTRDFDKLDDTVKKIIDKRNLVSYVSYNYSGELPGEAEININVGVEWSGKTLYYYYFDVKKQVLKLVQEAIVNPEGIMTVHQNHCSDYVILSEKIGEENTKADTDDGSGNTDSNNIDDSDNADDAGTNTAPLTSDTHTDMRLLFAVMIVSIFTMEFLVIRGRNNVI